ncbi:MAG: hypothetical protein NZ523_07800 [Elioraea sp.]|nr:hypothetical protein [Elioraea sp.]
MRRKIVRPPLLMPVPDLILWRSFAETHLETSTVARIRSRILDICSRGSRPIKACSQGAELVTVERGVQSIRDSTRANAAEERALAEVAVEPGGVRPMKHGKACSSMPQARSWKQDAHFRAHR